MNYELAKRLKDAGFPHLMREITSQLMIETPTLSELIEACGEKLDLLERTGMVGQEKWRASVDEDREGYGTSIYGETPEEAVANLWLSLQAKEEER